MRNQMQHAAEGKRLTAAQKKWNQLVLSLEPRKQGGINHPINTGPLKVRFGSGAMASV